MRRLAAALLLVALTSGLAGAAPLEDQHTPPPAEPPASAPEASPAEPPPDEVQELQAIGAYRVMRSHTPASAGEMQRVNPFQARKARGFHGSIYEYHRNDNLDARNFFDPVGQPLPEFKRNQFGAQLGWEVGSRLSLFGSYDGLRIVQGSTIVSRVPSLAQRQGDFSELNEQLVDPFTGAPLPGNRIPAERIHPAARRLLEVFPLPNRNEAERNYVNSDPQVENVDSLLFRADYRWTDDTKLLGRYSFEEQREVEAQALPEFGIAQTDQDYEFDLALNHNFSERLTTDLEFGFRRNTDFELSANAGRNGLFESLGIGGITINDELDQGYPDLDISGYAEFGDDESPSASVRNRFIVEAGASYVMGDHELQFGAELLFKQLNNFRSGNDRRGTFEFGGSFTGDALADFLFGLPETAERVDGSDRVDMRRAEYEFFFVDDWRVAPQLNLTMGVRYNYESPPRSQRPLGGFFPLLVEPEGAGQVVISGTPEAEALGFGSDPRTLVRPDRNDWAPQLGIAYSPFGNNRLVVRSGYGVFYDSLSDWQAVRFMGRNFPFFRRETAVSSSETPQLDLANPFTTAAPPAIIVRGVDPGIRNSYLQFWSLVVQKRLFDQWRFDVGYFGGKGTKLQRLLPGNVPLPGPGSIQERRPDPAFGSFSIVNGSGAWSEHRLQADVERQLADGFALRGGFVWRQQLSDVVFFDVSNPRNLAAERGQEGIPRLSGFFNYILHLPGRPGRASGFLRRALSGWRLSGTTRFVSGSFFTVRLSGDPNNDGLSADRSDRLSHGNLPSGERSVDRWFDTGAFAEPAGFGFGDAGRNILEGPGFQVWDVALSKRTALADGHFLEFRLELFNAFNHVNFFEPEATFGTSTFGQIFNAHRAREIEIALKYSF